MDELIQCYLCDRKRPAHEMGPIKVNGRTGFKACLKHDIEPTVSQYFVPPGQNQKTAVFFHVGDRRRLNRRTKYVK